MYVSFLDTFSVGRICYGQMKHKYRCYHLKDFNFTFTICQIFAQLYNLVDANVEVNIISSLRRLI
eukprot:snap_masked-scaffold_47-processed-gene-1.76-mRNA-1 protein AED:0.47 eAED:1.00 QI:0/0/0/1/1/1/2/0/64